MKEITTFYPLSNDELEELSRLDHIQDNDKIEISENSFWAEYFETGYLVDKEVYNVLEKIEKDFELLKSKSKIIYDNIVPEQYIESLLEDINDLNNDIHEKNDRIKELEYIIEHLKSKMSGLSIKAIQRAQLSESLTPYMKEFMKNEIDGSIYFTTSKVYSKKMVNAIATFAPEAYDENILLLKTDAIVGVSKSDFIITDQYLYLYINFKRRLRIPIDEINIIDNGKCVMILSGEKEYEYVELYKDKSDYRRAKFIKMIYTIKEILAPLQTNKVIKEEKYSNNEVFKKEFTFDMEDLYRAAEEK